MKLPGPDHPITIAPVAERVVVRFHDTVVADSCNALALQEADYPEVLYLPRADAALVHYLPSERHSHCPYKGEASYFTLQCGDVCAVDAVWSYPAPFPAMAAIREHLAFYPNQVRIVRIPPERS